MITYHPDTNTLAEFAANSLSSAQSIVVATHIEACDVCRQRLAELECIGGALFESAEPVDVDASLFDSVLAKLDEVEEAPAANDANASDLAWTVKQVRQGNLEGLNWRKVTKTLRLRISAIDGARVLALSHCRGWQYSSAQSPELKQRWFYRAVSATRVVHITLEILLLVKRVKSTHQRLSLVAIVLSRSP